MTMHRVLCTILFAIGYSGSTEAQEAPIPQLSPGSARQAAPVFMLPPMPSSPQSIKVSVARGIFACPFCAGRCPGTLTARSLTRRGRKLPFIECVAAIAAKAPSHPRFT